MKILLGFAIGVTGAAMFAAAPPRPVVRVAFLSASEGDDYGPPRKYVSAAGEYDTPPDAPPPPAAEEFPPLPDDAFAVPKFTHTSAPSPEPVQAPAEDPCESERADAKMRIAELQREVSELQGKLAECLSRPAPVRGIASVPTYYAAPPPQPPPVASVPIYRGDAASCVTPQVRRRGLFGFFR